MKPMRILFASALTVALTSAAIAQDDDVDETLEGGPIVSEKFNGGKGPAVKGDDPDEQSATQHRRGHPGRYDRRRDWDDWDDDDDWDRDRYGRDRYGRDRYGYDRYGGSQDVQYSTLYCRDRGDEGRRRFCAAPRGADRIYFDRRRSKAPCRRGRDYGIDRGGVWVANGCRANFTVVYYPRGYGRYDGYDRYGRRGDRRYDDWDDRDRYGRGYYEPEYITCQSKERRYTTCRLPSGFKRVELARQRSDAPCRKGRDWGVRRSGLWVDNGCRATFAVTFDRGGRYSGW
ncbi:MAG: DUF3011 domain-containing protein [Parvularcula sp.]